MKDLEVDQCLAELMARVGDVGDRVNLIGPCQGGWVAGQSGELTPATASLGGQARDAEVDHDAIRVALPVGDHQLVTEAFTPLGDQGNRSWSFTKRIVHRSTGR